ncbi:MAG TPA: ATP-binding protein [Acidobacteriota bacterium]|nr:ATP-binding protein [Acidobacteriota bacterium]
MLDFWPRALHGVGRRTTRKPHLRLAVALPFVTALLALGVGLYSFEVGRTDATHLMSPHDAARVWAAPPASWLWLLGLTAFGACIGLAIALAFTRQLRTLAKRTEFLARRNFSFPVELEADGEVAPLVSAINDLLESVRDYARRSVVEGLISFARDGRVLSINPRAAVALGVDADLMIGREFSELIPEVPDNIELTEALVGALERSEPFDLRRLAWVNRRGQRLTVDLQGTVLAGEESIISVLVVFERAADTEKVQRQVSRAHRLMVIGGFAAELAHEIRNPLSSVLGLVQLLHERLPPGDEGHSHLDVLSRASQRIERLVGQLLDLVPTEIHDLEQCDISALVRDTVEFVRMGRTEDDEVVLSEDLEPELPPCKVDPERLGRAVENLLRNAYAHTPAGGCIEVATRHRGAQVEVTIANTGSFVAPEDRERIFQPFVSGRGGTGLGLAIAQQIVYAHGGSIDVDSTPEHGTVFILRLPLYDAGFVAPTQVAGGQELAAGAA